MFLPQEDLPLCSPGIDKEIDLRLNKRSLRLGALRVQTITLAPISFQTDDLFNILEPCCTNDLVSSTPGP